jgi:hypothetical protein
MLLCLLAICGCRKSDGPAKTVAEAPAREIPLEASATVNAAGRPLGREALSLAGGAVRIWYADLGDSLGIRVASRDAVVVHVDMNQNGSLDRLVDEKFGALDDGSLCVQFEHDQGDAPQCNEVASQAKSLVLPSGDELDTLWKIPKAELGRSARSANIGLELFNTESQKSTFLPAPPFSQVYVLRFGRAAAVDGISVASPPPSNPLSTTPPAVKTASPPADKPASPAVTDTPTPPQPGPQEPVISWFTAERNTIVAGESVRLAWSVTNGDVRIDPGIGSVTPIDQRSEHPSSTTLYTLTAVGAGGVVKTQTVRVEVIESPEITRFYPEKPVVFLDDTIVLIWQTKGAAEVTVGLISGPEGSRFQYPATTQAASGRLAFKVTRDEFTRYGNYEFQLIAKGASGPVSKSVKVFLRQK